MMAAESWLRDHDASETMSARGARRSVSAWPAITSLAFALLLACGRARAADEIHWTMISPTSVTFDWRGANPTLQYGQTNGYGSTATGIPPVPMPFSSPDRKSTRLNSSHV